MSVIEGNQGMYSGMAGTWREKLKQRLGRIGAYCSVFHNLLNLLSYKMQDHLPTVSCSQSTSIIKAEYDPHVCSQAKLV